MPQEFDEDVQLLNQTLAREAEEERREREEAVSALQLPCSMRLNLQHAPLDVCYTSAPSNDGGKGVQEAARKANGHAARSGECFGPPVPASPGGALAKAGRAVGN